MTQEQAIQQALAKAANNSSFRASLLADAKGVLGREYPGITFSDNIQLDIELSDDDLEMVAGGWGDTDAGGGGVDGGDTTDPGTGGESGGTPTTPSGCYRGQGVGNDGTKGQGKGKGQDTGVGKGLETDFKG